MIQTLLEDFSISVNEKMAQFNKKKKGTQKTKLKVRYNPKMDTEINLFNSIMYKRIS